MLELLRKLVRILLPIPSRNEAEPDGVFEWRQAVGLSIILLGVVQMAFILFAIGWLSFTGMTGFALASDFAKLNAWSQETRVSQIEARIADDRRLQCEAIMEQNERSMRYAYDKLQADVDAYTLAAAHPPRTPECSELIPANGFLAAPTPSARVQTPAAPTPAGAK